MLPQRADVLGAWWPPGPSLQATPGALRLHSGQEGRDGLYIRSLWAPGRQRARLSGLAVGDDSQPGIGDKPARTPNSRTSCGSTTTQHLRSTRSLQVRPRNAAPHASPRLASPNPKDRRISFGCINLPPNFYDRVLGPAVRRTGAIVYILPEIRQAQEVFGSWDVTDPAARPPALRARRSDTAPVNGRPPRAYRETPVAVTSDSAAVR